MNKKKELKIFKINLKKLKVTKLKCELGDIEDEEKDNSQYKSIISHEDRELLNLYKVKKTKLVQMMKN